MSEEDAAANALEEAIGELETPQIESAPIEQTIPEDGETSEKTEITQPEPEKTVPLSALQKERELRKQAEEQAAIFAKITEKGRTVPTEPIETDGLFEPEVATNLEKWYAKKRAEDFRAEQELRSQMFVEKHQEELKDPLLDAMTRKVISDANRIGKIIDQEEALGIAKTTLDARLSTAEAKAKTTGFDEGQGVALKKTQAGAVGDTSVKVAPPNVDAMSPEEYREYFGIPVVDI